YVAYGDTRRGIHFGSGIVIMSEYPILATDQMKFSKAVLTDAMVQKGALHARIAVPGLPVPLEMYTTHFNSDPDPAFLGHAQRTREVRTLQQKELREFIEKTALPGSPRIIAGDFNFSPEEDAYNEFTLYSGMSDSALTCALSNSCTGTEEALD